MVDKEKAGRERLEKALSIYEEDLMQEFPPENGDVSWSEQHEAEIEKLIRRSKKQHLKKLIGIGKIAAVFAIVLCVIFKNDIFTYGEKKYTSTLYSYTNEGLREITWYKFLPDDDSAPKFLNTLFEPTYIPEEFELIEQKTQRYYVKEHSYWFENEAGEDIRFNQNTITRSVGFNTKMQTVEILQVRDIEVVCAISNEEGITLFWSNYGYTFRLKVPQGFTKEECMKIFDSIQKVRE